jgi:hypothetical protein
MSVRKKLNYPIVLGFGLLLLLFTAAIVARPLFLVFCVVLVFVFIYFNYSKEEKKLEEAVVLDSPALRDIRQSLTECATELTKLEKEVRDINDEISDMQLHLKTADELHPEALVEARILISRFEEQLILRKTKITFYKICRQKLDSLKANHELALTLENKQKKLRKYQENQYEELANMESLRSNLEREVLYLKTINQLSNRMLSNQSLQEAEALKSELVAVTEELRRI